MRYKCLSCNRNYSNKLDEELKKKFKNTFKFSNNDIKKFILLLRKSVYPYKYVDDREKFNETTLSEKKKKFIATWTWKKLQMQITCMEKEFVKTLK